MEYKRWLWIVFGFIAIGSIIIISSKLRLSKKDLVMKEFAKELTIKLNNTSQLLHNPQALLTLVAVDSTHKKCQITFKSLDEEFVNIWVDEKEFFPETKLFGTQGLYLLDVGKNYIIVQIRSAGKLKGLKEKRKLKVSGMHYETCGCLFIESGHLNGIAHKNLVYLI